MVRTHFEIWGELIEGELKRDSQGVKSKIDNTRVWG